MTFRVTVAGGRGASVEALEWVLRGSGFSVLTATPPAEAPAPDLDAGAPRTGPAHQARELLNRVALLTRCLQLPDVTDGEWRQWPSDIADANRRLEILYAGGLSRDFRGEPTASHRHAQAGVA